MTQPIEEEEKLEEKVCLDLISRDNMCSTEAEYKTELMFEKAILAVRPSMSQSMPDLFKLEKTELKKAEFMAWAKTFLP